MSPTQRSLKQLRNNGYLVQVVETWNSYTRTRRDLFGFADLLAIKPGEIVAVQTTSGSHTADRVKKIKTTAGDNAKAWLKAGGKIVVHGWRKLKLKRGGKAVRWSVVEHEITEKDFDDESYIGDARPRRRRKQPDARADCRALQRDSSNVDAGRKRSPTSRPTSATVRSTADNPITKETETT